MSRCADPLAAVFAAVAACLGVPAAALAAGSPTGVGALSPTRVKPVLSWTAPSGSGLTYFVYRNGTKVNATATSATTYNDTTVPAQGTFSYTVSAVEAGVESGPSSALSVVYDTTAPTVPTSFTGTTPTNAKPSLSWVASTDALSGIDHYDVLRGGVVVGSPDASTTTFTDTALAVSGSQTYTVRAVDAAGNVSGVATKSILYDALPPSAPTLTLSAATNGAPVLGWGPGSTDTPTGGQIARYDVWRDGAYVGSPTPLTGTTFTDTTVPGTGSYSYVV